MGRATPWVLAGAAALALGCGGPTLTRDGQLVFAQGGAKGASVLTANGVEFLDSADVPRAVVRRSALEPWQPATGFLLPADGVWRETSHPVAIQGEGLAIVLRASDAIVPSWGGEVLIRIDAIVPAAAYPAKASSVRRPKRLAIVVDGYAPNTGPLVNVALDDLGEKDRVVVIDSAGARTVVPLVPGNHRTLLEAAVERLTAPPTSRPASRERARPPHADSRARDLPKALAAARSSIAESGGASEAHVLVVTDGSGLSVRPLELEVAALSKAGVLLTVVGAPDGIAADTEVHLGGDVHLGGTFEEREEAVARAVPPPGDSALEDVTLSISSVPAPTHVLEVSGGASGLSLDEDHFHLGDLYVGEARTEVARIAVPAWVPGEPFDLFVRARYRDPATGRTLDRGTSLRCRYSNDVAEIASMRHGDVIAYASALAMVRRLDRAFVGRQVDRLGGLRPLVAWQARSLGALARRQRDPALGLQAEVLTSLLRALPE